MPNTDPAALKRLLANPDWRAFWTNFFVERELALREKELVEGDVRDSYELGKLRGWVECFKYIRQAPETLLRTEHAEDGVSADTDRPGTSFEEGSEVDPEESRLQTERLLRGQTPT